MKNQLFAVAGVLVLAGPAFTRWVQADGATTAAIPGDRSEEEAVATVLQRIFEVPGQGARRDLNDARAEAERVALEAERALGEAQREVERIALERDLAAERVELETELEVERETLARELEAERFELETDLEAERAMLEHELEAERTELELELETERATLERELDAERTRMDIERAMLETEHAEQASVENRATRVREEYEAQGRSRQSVGDSRRALEYFRAAKAQAREGGLEHAQSLLKEAQAQLRRAPRDLSSALAYTRANQDEKSLLRRLKALEKRLDLLGAGPEAPPAPRYSRGLAIEGDSHDTCEHCDACRALHEQRGAHFEHSNENPFGGRWRTAPEPSAPRELREPREPRELHEPREPRLPRAPRPVRDPRLPSAAPAPAPPAPPPSAGCCCCATCPRCEAKAAPAAPPRTGGYFGAPRPDGPAVGRAPFPYSSFDWEFAMLDGADGGDGTGAWFSRPGDADEVGDDEILEQLLELMEEMRDDLKELRGDVHELHQAVGANRRTVQRRGSGDR